MGRTGRPQPSYHGKPLSDWFRQYSLDLQPWSHGALDSNEALDSIVGAGCAGIPYLAEELKSQGSASSPVLIFLWSKLPAKARPHTKASIVHDRLGGGLPLAPLRFSTMKDWPSRSASDCAIRRAMERFREPRQR